MSCNPSELTVKQAAARLAARAMLGLRIKEARAKQARDKLAFDLEALKKQLSEGWGKLQAGHDPAGTPLQNTGWLAGRNALIGGGIGGLAGLGRSALSDQRKKDPLGDMFTGAMLGGSLGGAGTLAYQGLQQVNAPTVTGLTQRIKDTKKQLAMTSESAVHAKLQQELAQLEKSLPAAQAAAGMTPEQAVAAAGPTPREPASLSRSLENIPSDPRAAVAEAAGAGGNMAAGAAIGAAGGSAYSRFKERATVGKEIQNQLNDKDSKLFGLYGKDDTLGKEIRAATPTRQNSLGLQSPGGRRGIYPTDMHAALGLDSTNTAHGTPTQLQGMHDTARANRPPRKWYKPRGGTVGGGLLGGATGIGMQMLGGPDIGNTMRDYIYER